MNKLLLFVLLPLMLCGTVMAQDARVLATENGKRWKVGLSLAGFGSIFTYGRLLDGGIKTWDTLAPGYGFETFGRYQGLRTRGNNTLHIELGIGYFYSRGLVIHGRPIPGGNGITENLGRYENHAIAVPLRLRYEFAVRNTPLSLGIGLEWFRLPRGVNPALPIDYRANFGPRSSKNNFNELLQIGFRLPRCKWLDTVGVLYRRSRWDFFGNDKRIIGIQLISVV